jgi:hypothetical protein
MHRAWCPKFIIKKRQKGNFPFARWDGQNAREYLGHEKNNEYLNVYLLI